MNVMRVQRFMRYKTKRLGRRCRELTGWSVLTRFRLPMSRIDELDNVPGVGSMGPAMWGPKKRFDDLHHALHFGYHALAPFALTVRGRRRIRNGLRSLKCRNGHIPPTIVRRR